jgi:hypothetical protein
MITFGLNRPLFSFGLSYPGYFFVVIEDGTGRHIFKVYEPNRFKAFQLIREFKAAFGERFVAYATERERLGRDFYTLDVEKEFTSIEVKEFLAKEKERNFKAAEYGRIFKIQSPVSFIATESERTFIASVGKEYG